ncbi:PepSY-associated TM helix domain-containing protein [Pseudonocardia endophytica]|uniref:Putative iron-regulated membrane protein n=1 Tax=Pseudonocardia endophytica TaxID=401976 RepID=A0A4R1I794_PSEEN|nr:PepSY-associated TM helix domain-containing protein [Pseudonocardia endophytica]TCK25982.1 putative iron-regulated membrane protein [Pseudonocardia endophytica]
MVTTEPTPPAPARRSPGADRWAGLRPLLVRLHFYVGLFVGPFLLVAATTGLLYTLTPQIERFVHADALTAQTSGPAAPLSAQVAAATATQPGLSVTDIRPAPEPGATTRVSFDAGLPDDYSRTVFVDPSTARVQTTLDTYGEWLPVRAWFDDLHRTLLLGDVGRVYSEMAASWMWVLALSGLALWTVRSRPDKRIRRMLLPRNAGTGRARLRSWHGAIGTWAAIGMLFLSATGLTWSQFAGANVTSLRSALDWSTPTVSSEIAGAAAPTGTIGTQADRVLAAARGAGIDGPVELVPGGRGEAWSVAQTTRSWPTRQDSAAVDPATGRVAEVLRFDDWPVAAKLARWGVDAHMGLLFGLVNQIVLALFAMSIIALVLLGYRMWWRRRPLDGGVAGPPGARARPSLHAVATVGAVAVLLGLAVPLLGASLIGFLLLDGAVQAWRERGGRSGPGPDPDVPDDALEAADR